MILWAKFKRFLHCLGYLFRFNFKHLGYDTHYMNYVPTVHGYRKAKVTPATVGCTCGKVFWESKPHHYEYEGQRGNHER